MKNVNDYMSFRLKTYSEEEKGEETKEEVKTEGEGETATASEEGAGEEETKTEGEGEEKSGEKSEEGELETHSVRSVFWDEVVAKMIDKVTVAETKIVSYIVALILIALEKLNVEDAIKDELKAIKELSKKEDVTEEDVNKIKEVLIKGSELVSSEMDKEGVAVEVLDDVKNALSITQKEAKEAGIETGTATYSKMKVYSKADTIKAHLYLGELGWEKIGPESYLVPGTDQVVSVWTDEPTDDTMAKAQLKNGGTVTGVQQSFEDFKNFIDAVIKDGVGSYSDEDEQKDAIEIVEKREEEVYSDDEIAEKAEELEKEAEELKEEAQELKEKVEGETEAKPEGETVANSECPECGQDPCVCEEKKSEGEVAANCGGFGARLMEKLNRG